MDGEETAQDHGSETVTGAQETPAAGGGHMAETHATTEAHGGEHGTAFPPFDSATFSSQLLWLAISFAALYFLMSKIALPRIGNILEVRRDRIEGDLAEAERMRRKTEQAIAAYEEALAEARSKAQGIAGDTREAIKADIDARRAGVESDLAKKMVSAEARIEKTKIKALESVDEIAADTAAALASRLIGRVTAKSARDAVARVVKG